MLFLSLHDDSRMSLVNWKPSLRDLKLFAILQMGFCLCFVGMAHFRHPDWRPEMLWGILALSGAVGLLGIVRPAGVRPIYVAWLAAVFPIGWLMTHLLLAIVYYGVFTPIGLLRRLLGGDPLQRQFDKTAPTYWKTRPAPPPTNSYFRQF